MSVQVFAMESKPYAGQEKRHIKALSISEIEGLKNGEGMGLAKAAELNHFPGPLHVIDEARKLDLSKEQLKLTRQLFDKMKQEAVMTGNQIITSEQQLDKMFASGTISEVQLQNKLKEIGEHRTKLRYIHLKTHLQQKKIMSKKQIEHYDVIRGYTGDTLHQHNHHH